VLNKTAQHDCQGSHHVRTWCPARLKIDTLQFPAQYVSVQTTRAAGCNQQEASEDVTLKTKNLTAVVSVAERCVRSEKQQRQTDDTHCLGFVNVKHTIKQVLFASLCLVSRASNRYI
jgi:hypothetical protein